jgi:hypothetical protein
VSRTDPRPHYGERQPRVGNTGYIYVWEPSHSLAMRDGYVLEHRKVVFDAGIEIPPGYLVHHKDEDKTNNDLSNLEVISRRDHQRHHLAKYPTPKDKWRAAYQRAKQRGSR